MSIIDASTTLASLDAEFRNKIDSLQICVDLRGGWGEDTVTEFEELTAELTSLRQDITYYRNIVANAQKDIYKARYLMEQMQQLSEQLTHMKLNMPAHVPHASAPAPVESTSASHLTTKQTSTNKENIKTNVQEKGTIKTGTGKTRQIAVIAYITVEEFESVPKYIRGRLQYDQVNNAVDAVNKSLENKYTLMARPRSKISELEMRIVTSCRRQENQETRGLHFVTDDDIKRWSKLKLDTAGRSLMTVLRTLKRLREVRGPGNLVRYAVIT